ncbi:MAG: TRAP transporter permease [bacterium]
MDIIIKRFVVIVAVVMSLFQFYTCITMPFTPMIQRPIHLLFAFIIIFLSSAQSSKNYLYKCIDYAMSILTVAVMLYMVLYWEELALQATDLNKADLLMGITAVIITLEAARKKIGIWLPLISIIFIIYAYVGKFLPGVFGFTGISLERFVSTLYMSNEGIFGIPVGVSATYAFVFILFSQFMLELGGGKFFIDLTFSLLGQFRGGPAKIAVIASSLMGTVSGSAVANVAATGSVTIPLMKSVGYRPSFAAAVEAVASTGGQLMPPIMGTAAFIMAEILNVPYVKIIIAATVPAILYYTTAFAMVDFVAAKDSLHGLKKEELPIFIEVLKSGWFYIIALLVLIYVLVVLQYAPERAAVWGIVTLCGTKIIRDLICDKTFEWKKIISALEQAAYSALVVASATACAGIIIGVFGATGLSLRFSSIMIDLAGNSLLILLILTMVASMILGMGLTTTPAYIILAVLAAPAIVNLGIAPIAAHLFVFYFGILAPITPPVGLAFYVAAGIAGADPMESGINSVKLALAGFLIPFAFIYNPAMLGLGTMLELLWIAFTAAIGCICLAGSIAGYIIFTKIGVITRGFLFACSISLITPEYISDFIGLAIVSLVIGTLIYRTKKVYRKHTAVI